MLIWILKKAVFSFEKGSIGQKHSCLGSHHPVKKIKTYQNQTYSAE